MQYSYQDAVAKLSAHLQQNRLMVFAGSGISVASGLPPWDDLIKSFIEMFQAIARSTHPQQVAKYDSLIADARTHAGRDPIRVATVMKQEFARLMHNQNSHVARTEYRDWLTRIFGSKLPNDNHHFIVRTDYPYILTTNYDLLLEKAAGIEGFFELARSSFTFKEANKIAARVLHKRPAIVHAHGIYGNLDSEEVIFTADDYRKLIKNKYDSFSFCLRMLFFNYSCLFVGYGASDPHLEDVVQELSALYESEDQDLPLRDSFLVLRKDRADRILEQYKERMRTHLVVVKDFDETTKLLHELSLTKPRVKEFDFLVQRNSDERQSQMPI